MRSSLLRAFLATVTTLAALAGAEASRGPAATTETCADLERVNEMLAKYDVQLWVTIPVGPGAPGQYQKSHKAWSCNGMDPVYRVLRALRLLHDLPESEGLGDEFDHGVFNGQPAAFFSQRIRTILIESSNHDMCPSLGTMAYVAEGETATMHVCPHALNYSNLYLVGTLMHEARHIDGFPHVICDHGQFGTTAEAACDPSYETGGSYGVGVEFDVKVARSPEVPAAVRDEARGLAIGDLLERFNELPLGLRSGAMLLTNSGTLSFYDGKLAIELLHEIPERVVTTMRASLPTFFDPLFGSARSYVGAPELVDTAGPFAIEYRDEMTPAARSAVVDVYYGLYSCFLYASSLHCEIGAKAVDLPLPEGVRARQFVVMRAMPVVGDMVFVLGEDGGLYLLPSNYAGLAAWKTSDIVKNEDLTGGFLSLAMLPGFRRMAILADGTLAEGTDSPKAWAPVPEFQNLRFKKMMAPALWSERIGDL